MNINDLKTGYLVKFREEGFGVVACSDLGKIIIYEDYSYDSIENWNDDLTDSQVDFYDIVAVYKPKRKAYILSTLDDYELIWEEENLDARAFEVCSVIEKKYKCNVTYRKTYGAKYEFKFDYGEFNTYFHIIISNYSLDELIYKLSNHVEWAIISYYKK